jgi:hypothetical protein
MTSSGNKLYIYRVEFASNSNDNWYVNHLGLFKNESDAVEAVYQQIMDTPYNYLSKEALNNLDELENYSCVKCGECECEDEECECVCTCITDDELSVNECPKTEHDLYIWCNKYGEKGDDFGCFVGRNIFDNKRVRGWGFDIDYEEVQ